MFSGVQTNFGSFVSGCVWLCLVFQNFILNLQHLRKHFSKKRKKNAYSTKFVEKCVVNFVNNIFAQKTYAASVPKLDFRIALPY